jgi:1-deoxy-D-xylulose-5-phosphate reductoisomerase
VHRLFGAVARPLCRHRYHPFVFEHALCNSLPPQRLIVLGSTGSIGVNTLAVVEHLRLTNQMHFEIVGLAGGSRVEVLLEQARRFNVQHLAMADAAQVANIASDGKRVMTGPEAALLLIEHVARPGDLVVGAMVGSAGIPAILAAIDRGCDIALANKETLVAAGAIVMPRVREKGVSLLPIDSEHSAVSQCLEANVKTSKRQNVKTCDRAESIPFDVSTFRRLDVSVVRRIILTASGGPFRTWSAERMARATVDDALKHPTWSMGPKVTIDSASLMNKALEIIEAHWLFDVPASKIDVIIHPQSIVHGMVEFADGSVIAQMSPPDMRTPIQYALTWPQRLDGSGCTRAMDWSALGKLEFEQVDFERFPAPLLAKRAIESGGTAGAVLNAANETAVQAFLERRIGFSRIVELVREACEAIEPAPVHSMQDIAAADAAAREFVSRRVADQVKCPVAVAGTGGR